MKGESSVNPDASESEERYLGRLRVDTTPTPAEAAAEQTKAKREKRGWSLS